MKGRTLAVLAIVLVAACGRSAQNRGRSAVQQTEGTSRSAKRAALKAAAANLTDFEKRVPHYFGPFPNWANSPFTLPDAQVSITGDGSGATATATVGAGGAITEITVTNPGNGYSNARVDIVGAGTGATAKARINENGYVSQITLNQAGGGYVAPTVSITGGRGSGATATAFGGVDAVTIHQQPPRLSPPPHWSRQYPPEAEARRATGHGRGVWSRTRRGGRGGTGHPLRL